MKCSAIIAIAAVSIAGVASAQDADGTAAAMKELADGRPVKLVWIQDAGPTACPYSEKPTLKLMGFDTEDGLGEREIIAEQSQYTKPLITDDGTRVVYGDPSKGGIFIVDFKGGAPRKILGEGSFMDVWEDPRDHVEWVYVSESVLRGDRKVNAIYRHRLDDPSVSELVWDKTGCHHFMLNGDGTAASGGGDGGNSPQGVFFLPNKLFAQRAGGCWPAMCPDDSLRSWVFTGNHRSIHFCFTTDRSGKGSNWGVRFDKAPGLEIKSNEEMYHPRWSNHPRFLVLSSPFSHWSWSAEEGKIPNDVAAGVEVYLGKFTEDFHDIERWVKVSHNRRGDYWPDAWVKPDGPPAWLKERPSDPPEAEEGPHVATPLSAGTVYRWVNGSSDNQIVNPDGSVTQCGGRFLRAACLAQDSLLDLNDGAFVPDGAVERWLPAAREAKAASFEIAITPSVASLTNPGTILDFGENLRLVQRGDSLRLSLLGLPHPVDMPVTLKAGKPLHLVVSLSADFGLLIAIDGKRMLIPADVAKASPAGWREAPLVLGDSADGGSNWPGRLESITFLGRAMALLDAWTLYSVWEMFVPLRTEPAKRLVAEALLVDDCDPADPLGIAPYKRCFSVRHYKVLKVHEGEAAGEDINVAQWSVMDGEVFAPYLGYKPGNTYRLTLEPWESHPEQESERMTMGDEVDIETPLYYQPPAIALPPAPAQGGEMLPWQIARGGRDQKYGLILAAPLTIRDLREPKPFDPGLPGGLDTAGQPVAIDGDSFRFSNSRALYLGGNGQIAGVAVIKGGSDVPSRPKLVFDGVGSGARAEAILGVDSLEIVRLGTGFTEPPRLEFDPPEIHGGSPPNVQVFIDKDSGALSWLVVHSPGYGYTRIPRVRVVGTGTGAEIKAHMRIVGVHVTDGGSGYAAMPKVTVEGAPDAILQPISQDTLLRYRGSQGNAIFENTESGDVDQDGARIIFDWAAPGNNVGARELRNKGRWRMHDGAIIGFMTSTGRGLWIPHFSNTGTFVLGAGCNLALQHVRNYGEMVLEAPSQLCLADAWGAEDEFSNLGRLRVTGTDTSTPVIFGWTSPGGCGKRTLVNGNGDSQATFEIANGGAFRIIGSQARVSNTSGSVFALQPGSALEILSCDNGSSHLFNNREAIFANAKDAKFRFGGRLVVQGNHGGFAGVRNDGQVRIEDGAVLERLPNSSGPGSFYKADANSALFENRAGGVVAANGRFKYVNATGSDEGRMLLFRNFGTLEIADRFAMQDVNLSVKAEGEGEAILRMTLGNDDGAAPLMLASSFAMTAIPPGNVPRTGVLSIDGESATALEIVVPQGMKPRGRHSLVRAMAVNGAFKKTRLVGSDADFTIEPVDNGLDVVFQ